MTAVSVVIPTHHRASYLASAIEPLLCDEAAAEVIIVIDGADAATVETLEAMEGAGGRLRWYVLEPSQGAARARWHGIRRACCDIVLMLDDDERAHDGLVSGHLAHHQRRDHLLVVGSVHMDFGRDRPVLDRVVARAYEKTYASAMSDFASNPDSILDGLWGGNVSAPRSDLLAMESEILRFPRLPHEDQHFGIVAKARGMAALYDPDLRADHQYSRTWNAMLSDAEAFGRAQRVMARLHPELGDFDANAIPEPLNPVVELAVRASDIPWVAGAELSVLKTATWVMESLAARLTAERLLFVASQIARRRGRRQSSDPAN